MKILDIITRKVKIPLWFCFLLPFFAYLAWECYWFSQREYLFIKWHTHLMAYVYIWLAGLGMFWLLFRNNFSEKAKNAVLTFTSVIFALLLFEAYLIFSGDTKTYLEKVMGSYISPYTPGNFTRYHKWNPDTPHWIEKPEYRHWRPTNSLGLPDIEWAMEKQPGEIRILALGDSFTEGDGAPFDSTYVALLNKKLKAAGDTCYLMNGGVCGSDPFFNYIFLKDRLLVYKPDIIIQMLATHDLDSDLFTRGGLQRFKEDGTLQFQQPPWWEPVYAMSYVSRIFFHKAGYTELLRKASVTPAQVKKLNEQAVELFRQYVTLCREHGIQLIVLLRPDKDEIERNAYGYDLSPILDAVKPHAQILDLLPGYQDYIKKTQTRVEDYFYKYDGHHNPQGYEMMADVVYRNLVVVNDSIGGIKASLAK